MTSRLAGLVLSFGMALALWGVGATEAPAAKIVNAAALYRIVDLGVVDANGDDPNFLPNATGGTAFVMDTAGQALYPFTKATASPTIPGPYQLDLGRPFVADGNASGQYVGTETTIHPTPNRPFGPFRRIDFHAAVGDSSLTYGTDLSNGFRALGWQLLFADKIDNQGRIVGRGIYRHREHAYLLVPKVLPASATSPTPSAETLAAETLVAPVPEPSVLNLLGLVAVALGGRAALRGVLGRR